MVDRPLGSIWTHGQPVCKNQRERSKVVYRGINGQPIFITRQNTTPQRKVLEWELAFGTAVGSMA